MRRLAVAWLILGVASPAAWAQTPPGDGVAPGTGDLTLTLQASKAPDSTFSRWTDHMSTNVVTSLDVEDRLPRVESMSRKLRKNLTLVTDDLNMHLQALTFGLVDMGFDFTTYRGKVRLGAGDPDAFALRLDSDFVVRGSYARVTTRIELGLLGEKLSFQLPDFEVEPKSAAGEYYLELRLPLIEGRF